MTRDVQLPEPVAELLAVSRRVARPWLDRLVRSVASPPAGDSLDPELDAMIAAAAERLVDDLGDLLTTDVDAQASNPLTLFRNATRPLTSELVRRNVSPARRDPFAVDAFPDDVYGFYPAGWDDIDPALRTPGITWGAWKAMTVLQRRRDDGSR